MKLKDDNSPISYNSLAISNTNREELTSIEIQKILRSIQRANEVHLATIREVYYVDDVKNQTKSQVEYKIRIEFGERQGQEYESVTAMNLYGGIVNFSNFVYSPKDKALNNKNSEEEYMFSHDASQVVVAFMDGYPNRPFIIGGWHNTNNDIFAAKKVDGIRDIKEFNGIRLETNKDGEYILTYYGGPRDTKSKKAARASTAPTTFKIDKNGVFKIDDKENQKIEINRTSKTIEISQYSATKPDETYGKTDSSSPGDLVNTIILDKANKKIILKAKNGDAQVEILGNDKKIIITAGSSIIEIDGNSKKISLKGDLIDIGVSTSDLVVLGNQLIGYLSSHTHPFTNAHGSPSMTQPPAVPPPSSILSATVKVQS